MIGIGKLALSLSAGVFVAQEVERKSVQKRNDPQTYAETPVFYFVGAMAAIALLTTLPAQPLCVAPRMLRSERR